MTRLLRPAVLLQAIGAMGMLCAPLVLGEFMITLMNYAGVSAIAALGLVLLTGSGGMTSFGQAAFVGIGAYATGYISTAWGLSPWLGLVVALALTGVIALAIGAATLHLGGHYLPITTIAWGVAIYLLFGNSTALGQFGGLSHIPSLSILGHELARPAQIFYPIWITLGLCLLCASFMLGSRQGRAIRALRGGGVLVESLGIDSFRIKLCLFCISGLLAAVAGWLFAHMQHFISPSTFDLKNGIELLLMAILGGSGYVYGALLGSFGVILLKNGLQDLLPLATSQSGNLEIIVFGALFIGLLQYSPRGLAPLLTGLWPSGADDGLVKTGGPAPTPLPTRALPTAGEELMRVEGVTKRFGGLVAVDDVSFRVQAGQICALIGPNGAGKSTTFNLITGVLPTSSGRIFYRGRDVTGLRQRDLLELGVARTFQHVKLRPTMSCLENVMLGAYRRTATGFAAGALRLDRAPEAAVASLAADLIRDVGLGDSLHAPAGTLPLGKQRILEIARALASDPALLMLDEPAAGLRAMEKGALADLLGRLRAKGVTILLVEHDMEFLMGLADWIVVLNFGRKLAEGRPDEIRANREVQEAYLGGGE